MASFVTKREREDTAYYTVNWSELRKVDRHEIRKSVPSVAGIFEIYYLDRRKSLNMMAVAKAWYGGLRSEIRRVTDSELERDPVKKKILETRTCYYRYAEIPSYNDLEDIFLSIVEGAGPEHVEGGGK